MWKQVKILVHGVHNAYLNSFKDLSSGTNMFWISLEPTPYIVSQLRCNFLSWLTVGGHCNLQYYLVHLPFPSIFPGGNFCAGWCVWEVPLKLSLNLDNWFCCKTGFYNPNPLLNRISCCLIHWSWEIQLTSSNYDLYNNIYKIVFIKDSWSKSQMQSHNTRAQKCLAIQ